MEPSRKIILKIDCTSSFGEEVICTIFLEIAENVRIYDIKRYLQSLESFIDFTHSTLVFNGTELQENVYINNLIEKCTDQNLYLRYEGSRLKSPIINRNKSYFFDGKNFYETVPQTQGEHEMIEGTYDHLLESFRGFLKSLASIFFKIVIFILIMGQHLSREKILLMICILVPILIYSLLTLFFRPQSNGSIIRDVYTRLASNHEGLFRTCALTFLSFLFSFLPFDDFLIE